MFRKQSVHPLLVCTGALHSYESGSPLNLHFISLNFITGFHTLFNSISYSLDLRSCIAFSLFCNCERLSEFSIIIPVGACRRRTAVSTLFTFCPPAPLARIVSNVISAGLILISIVSSTKGYTYTETKLVCLLALESKGEIRTNRCTPFSLSGNQKHNLRLFPVLLFLLLQHHLPDS